MRHDDETAYAGGINQARNASAVIVVMLRGLKMYGPKYYLGWRCQRPDRTGCPGVRSGCADPLADAQGGDDRTPSKDNWVRSIAYHIKAGSALAGCPAS